MQLNYKWYYAAIMFFPFNCLKGIIYYIFYASKYSPINFLFGKLKYRSIFICDSKIKGPV